MKLAKSSIIRGSVMALAFAFVAVGAQFALSNTTYAAGGTATWTGAANDRKFSTPGNWAEAAIPENGDKLVFSVGPKTDKTTQLTNDVDVAYGGIEANYPATTEDEEYLSYELTRNVKLTDGAEVKVKNLGGFILGEKAQYIGLGSVLFTNGGDDDVLMLGDMNFAGEVTVDSQLALFDFPKTASKVTFKKNVIGFVTKNRVIDYPVELNSNDESFPVLLIGDIYSDSGSNGMKVVFKHVILKADANAYIVEGAFLEVQQLTANGFQLTRSKDSNGTLKIGSKVYKNVRKTTKLNGNKDEEYVVLNKETAILNGHRTLITVSRNGTLMGNGSVDILIVDGTIAPGESAGKITVRDSIQMGETAVYDVEILNEDTFDKIVVNSGGTVSIDGTLNVSFLSGGKVNKGEEFRIINNQGSEPIEGTFKGLKQGDKITVGDAVFSIDYTGGDGNDLVLTALLTAYAPGTPNTGVKTAALSPVVIALSGILSVMILAVAVRKLVQ